MHLQQTLNAKVGDALAILRCEQLLELVVNQNLALVLRVLKIVVLHVLKNTLGHLRACELTSGGNAEEIAKCGGQVGWLGETAGLARLLLGSRRHVLLQLAERLLETLHFVLKGGKFLHELSG